MIADDGTRLEWLGSTLKYQRYRGRRANTLSSSAPIRRLKATSSHGEMACMGRTSRSRRPCARGEVLCTEPGKMGQKRKCPGLRGTPFYPQEQTSSACPGMSVWCQERKPDDSLDQLIGAAGAHFRIAKKALISGAGDLISTTTESSMASNPWRTPLGCRQTSPDPMMNSSEPTVDFTLPFTT